MGQCVGGEQPHSGCDPGVPLVVRLFGVCIGHRRSHEDAFSAPPGEPRGPYIELFGCRSVRRWSSVLGQRTVVQALRGRESCDHQLLESETSRCSDAKRGGWAWASGGAGSAHATPSPAAMPSPGVEDKEAGAPGAEIPAKGKLNRSLPKEARDPCLTLWKPNQYFDSSAKWLGLGGGS